MGDFYCSRQGLSTRPRLAPNSFSSHLSLQLEEGTHLAQFHPMCLPVSEPKLTGPGGKGVSFCHCTSHTPEMLPCTLRHTQVKTGKMAVCSYSGVHMNFAPCSLRCCCCWNWHFIRLPPFSFIPLGPRQNFWELLDDASVNFPSGRGVCAGWHRFMALLLCSQILYCYSSLLAPHKEARREIGTWGGDMPEGF